MEYYIEQQKKLPVIGEYDVVVVGGGPAGISAALASAQVGAKTLLLERLGSFGGGLTNLLTPWPYAFGDGKNIIAPGIPIQIIKRIGEEGGLCGDPLIDQMVLVDAEIAKLALDKLVQEEDKLTSLLETWAVNIIKDGENIQGIIIENKSGRQVVYAKTVVDATGDADIVFYAEGSWVMSSKETIHPVTLMAKLANVDVEKIKKNNPQEVIFPGLLKGRSYPRPDLFIWKPFSKIVKDLGFKETPWWADWFVYLGPTPNENELLLNITGEINVDGTNTEEITKAEMISRSRVFEVIKQLKSNIPGFELCYLVSSSPILGVRETRRIVGEYTLTKQDILSQKYFEDTIARSCCPPGPHTPDGKDADQPLSIHPEPYTSFGIPLRCLIPKGIEGVVVAGRCISVEQSGLGAIRCQGTCMATGQAAGVSAALAVKTNTLPRHLKISNVESALEDLYNKWQ